MKNIEVISKSEIIEITSDPLSIYNGLKDFYDESDIFLLESMSGPAKDCNNSIIAFDPLLTLKVNEDAFSLTGNEVLIDFVCKNQALLPFTIQNNCGVIKDGNELIELLRIIETLFIVKKEGVLSDIKFGFFGYFGYDTVFYFEKIKSSLVRNKGLSTIHLTIYRSIINIDIKKGLVALTTNFSECFSERDFKTIINHINSSDVKEKNSDTIVSASLPTITRDEYYSWFEKAKYHIEIGDVYQIQLGHELYIESTAEPYEVYLRMRRLNPSPYMYFFKTTEEVYVIGASPELFVSLSTERIISMRPIAGTISNSSDLTIKEANKHALISNEKENAEHLMLVDLCRNDISKVCLPTSLIVNDLMLTEEYSHVIHLVSQVTGKLLEKYDKYDVLKAAFPAGTMTGTPKIKAMQLIEETEFSPRGIYAGCVGYFGFDDFMISALCIRTAIYLDGKYVIRASGGIVEDSSKQGEWEETINKLGSTYLAISGKELRDEVFIN